MIKRREFIAVLGAAMWPLVARAQQPAMRRIGVLMNLAADDPQIQARLAPFLQGLQEVGWKVGRNVRIDYRWVQAIPTAFEDLRRNWLRSGRTLSWPAGARSSRRFNR